MTGKVGVFVRTSTPIVNPNCSFVSSEGTIEGHFPKSAHCTQAHKSRLEAVTINFLETFHVLTFV